MRRSGPRRSPGPTRRWTRTRSRWPSRQLRQLYLESERAFDLVEVAGGYQLLTRPEFSGYLERFDTIPRPSRLSGPALETLAIIAYRQPIGRLEVEYVRGVGSAG
jgi:segregation and condensation protein B